MLSSQNESKVYIEIVKQLRILISNENLRPGDKLPSERELTERLNVGRSSVREALRALELLGLIETRRGEGTYIRDFRGNQLVQLLSTFILQDEKAINDVIETKNYIEMDCLRLCIAKYKDSTIAILNKALHGKSFSDEQFFYEIVQLADNHLLMRIWLSINDFYNSLKLEFNAIDLEKYANLISAIEARSELDALLYYKQLRNLSV